MLYKNTFIFIICFPTKYMSWKTIASVSTHKNRAFFEAAPKVICRHQTLTLLAHSKGGEVFFLRIGLTSAGSLMMRLSYLFSFGISVLMSACCRRDSCSSISWSSFPRPPLHQLIRVTFVLVIKCGHREAVGRDIFLLLNKNKIKDEFVLFYIEGIIKPIGSFQSDPWCALELIFPYLTSRSKSNEGESTEWRANSEPKPGHPVQS